jgi:hypothetical protein
MKVVGDGSSGQLAFKGPDGAEQTFSFDRAYGENSATDGKGSEGE